MELRTPDQLATHLNSNLVPIYLVGGNEPLLVDEAADQIRSAAKSAGYADREVFHAGEQGFQWDELRASAMAMSLFAQRRIIDLRLPRGKPGREGGEALTFFASDPPPDTLLLVVCHDWDKNAAKTRWARALAKAGASVVRRQLYTKELPGWIGRRLARAGLRPGPGVAQSIAHRVEGNLLAAMQEIDKLALLLGQGGVDLEQVNRLVADSARFTTFGLIDAVLAADRSRCIRILAALRAENTSLVLIHWALTEQLRVLTCVAGNRALGGDPQSCFKGRPLWPQRRQQLLGVAQRHPPQYWRELLQGCLRLDRQIKGRASGDPWQEAELISLKMAG